MIEEAGVTENCLKHFEKVPACSSHSTCLNQYMFGWKSAEIFPGDNLSQIQIRLYDK